MAQIEGKACSLRLAVEGKIEACEPRCLFWEAGGAVLAGTCLVERLGVDLAQPGLAEYLLTMRERIERVRDVKEAEDAHREFARRLGRDV